MLRFRLYALHILLLLSASLFAQSFSKVAYYSAASGKKGQALKTALANIIYTENSVGYDGIKEAYKTTDVRSDGYLWDIYSCTSAYVPGSAYVSGSDTENGGYNREHLIPQSIFNKAAPMVADLYHVYPVDAHLNSTRQDDCHGEVGKSSGSSNNNYSKWGAPSAKLIANGCTVSRVFEPNDELKGDVARTYFYMVTCYESKLSGWKEYGMFSNDTYPSLSGWAKTMLLEWSKADQVSEKETTRQTAIYATAQHNRNPFIDFPGLEEYIWGTYTDVAFDPSNYVNPYEGIEPDPEPDPEPEIVSGDYRKIVKAPNNWSGSYLIVYEDGNVAMNGGLTNSLDVTSNTISVTVVNNAIEREGATNAAAFTVAPTNNGYTIKSKSGLYMGRTSDNNGLESNASTTYVNTISLNSDGSANIVGSGGAYLRYNSASNQMRFRYYKSSSYTGQKPIALYVLAGDLNGDGLQTFGDVALLVDIALGKTVNYNQAVADINGDGAISIADVTALVNIILEK